MQLLLVQALGLQGCFRDQVSSFGLHLDLATEGHGPAGRPRVGGEEDGFILARPIPAPLPPRCPCSAAPPPDPPCADFSVPAWAPLQRLIRAGVAGGAPALAQTSSEHRTKNFTRCSLSLNFGMFLKSSLKNTCLPVTDRPCLAARGRRGERHSRSRSSFQRMASLLSFTKEQLK